MTTKMTYSLLGLGVFLLGVAAAGCGGGTTEDEGELPPTSSAADLDAWIEDGFYKEWACEGAEHDADPISPHAFNRICSNAAMSAHGDGEYPVDAAAVKELWDAIGGKVVGIAVSRHVKAGTTGDTWFWYEKVPLDSMAPHDDKGVVAFGNGDSGPAKDICVGCHAATGIDADHSGHDFVYVQVQ